MKTICPHCNYEYPDIDNNLLGQEVECAICKEIFVVEPVKIDRQIDIKPQPENIVKRKQYKVLSVKDGGVACSV